MSAKFFRNIKGFYSQAVTFRTILLPTNLLWNQVQIKFKSISEDCTIFGFLRPGSVINFSDEEFILRVNSIIGSADWSTKAT